MKITDLFENQAWHHEGGLNYTAEIAELQHAGPLTCPKCKKHLDLKEFKVMRDTDQDIQNWELDHDCKAHLVIFND